MVSLVFLGEDRFSLHFTDDRCVQGFIMEFYFTNRSDFGAPVKYEINLKL